MKLINKGAFKMRKFTKIIMIIILFLGICFSISNFTSSELNASPLMGAYVGSECEGDGNECVIIAFYEPPC
jgi:D-alanyl-lipoteichoic acid acyltransferase DltB (MBOAT superfamily)